MGANILAQTQNETGRIRNPLITGAIKYSSGTDFFSKFITTLINWGLTIGIVIFLFSLIVGAIQWILSGGDKQKLETSRGRVTTAIIGLVVLLSIFAILKLIEVFFGIKIIDINLDFLKLGEYTSTSSGGGATTTTQQFGSE